MFRLFLVTQILAAQILLGGCGGGGAGGGGAPAGGPPAPPPTPPPPVAVSAPPTGGYSWAFALAATGEGPVVRGVSPGPQNSFYVVGSFGAGAALEIGSVRASPPGAGTDLFLARISESGSVLWVRAFGGVGDDFAFDVATDSAGAAYVAGQITGAATLGGVAINAMGSDAFVAKFGPSGDVQWVTTLGGAGQSYANEIVTTPSGEAAVVGVYRGASGFAGGVTLPDPPSGTDDVFVARFSAQGAPLWARALSGPGSASVGAAQTEAGRGVGLDGQGRVLVTGEFTQSLSAVAPNATVMLSTPSAQPDCFLASYAASGALLWAQRFGGDGADRCRGVGGDDFGNVLFAGVFSGTMNIGSATLVSAGDLDVFVASSDRDGRISWAQRFGGAGPEQGAEIDVAAEGDVVISADFSGTATFASGSGFAGRGLRDPMLATFRGDGTVDWALAAGGAGDDVTFALATLPSGSVVSVGAFGSPSGAGPLSVDFGATTLTASRQAAFIALARATAPSPPPTPPPPTTGGLNLTAAADYAFGNGVRAVVVIEDGKTLLERYGGAGSATRGEFLASGTKSFTCALWAAAQDDGLIDLDEFAANAIRAWGPGGGAPDAGEKQKIKVRDLLALSSGLANTGSAGANLTTVDTYAQAIGARSTLAPDTAAIYGPNAFQAFGAYFELRTGANVLANGDISGGRDPVAYLQSRVLDRIGVSTTAWQRDIKGKPNLAGGASMTASHWARYGQFILQGGLWNGQRVVSEARIRRCSSYQTPAFAGYGMGWWLNRPVGGTYQAAQDSLPWPGAVTARWAAGGKIAPDIPDDMFMAYGAGNMKMFLVPSRNLVVVKLAGSADDNRFLGILLGTVKP
ncbi:MAG: serine hydrolase domain-containing protein [Phenylobacterium sp.]